MSIFSKIFKRGGKKEETAAGTDAGCVRSIPVVLGKTYHYLRVSEKGGEAFNNDNFSTDAVDIETWKGEDICWKAFAKCEFIKPVFFSVRVSMTTFDGCTFTNARFDSVTFDRCVFKNCRFVQDGRWSNRMGLVFIEGTRFENCEFSDITLDSICTRNGHAKIDLSKCKFFNVKIVNSDISRFVLPEGEEGRYGRILEKPMMGYKFAVPLLKEQYDLIAAGIREPSHFIDEHGLNRDIRHPDAFPPGIPYEDYMSLVEIKIPEGSVVFTADNRNFRANRAIVKSVGEPMNILGMRVPVFCAVSKYDNKTMYVPGEEVRCPDFDLEPSGENVPGIYFILDKPGE